MDTKSIKIRNSKFFKFIVIIFSVICFVGTYYYGQLLFDFYLDNWNENGFWLLTASDNVLSNGTSEFALKIRSETGNVRKLASEYRNDKYVESGEGWALKEAEIRELYKRNLEAEILEAQKNWVQSHYYYDENLEKYTYPNYSNQSLIIDFSSEDQMFADDHYVTFGDNNVFGLTKKADGYYYKGFPLEYAEIDLETIKSENEIELRQEIVTKKAAYKTTYIEIKEELASLQNYKYFLVNKSTGEIYTNMSGVTTAAQAKDEYYTDTEYFTSIINGEFVTSKLLDSVLTENGTTWYYDGNQNISFVTGDSGKYDYCFGKLDPDKYDMVVYVDTTNLNDNPEDVFTGIFNEWTEKNTNLDANRFLFFISIFLFISCLVILANFAGYMTSDDGKVKLAPIDKVPNSIHFIISTALIIVFSVAPIYIYMEGVTNWTFVPSLNVAIISAPVAVLLDELLMSSSRQIKNRVFWKNNLTYRLIIKNRPKIKKWVNSGIDDITHKEIKKNIYFVLTGYVALVAIFSFIPYVGFFLNVLLTIFAFLYTRKFATGLDSISSALTKAEKGDYDFSVDVESMPLSLQVMGENVNALTDGLNKALEGKVREERTKTELITNVSHDLKTPLTSIINYTDLLKGCDIKDEKANEYIGVLDEKTHYLKKLVEDLVEASKASSGNVVLNMAKIDLNELVEQIYGEYEDILEESDLSIKLNIPDEPVYTVVDGEKTYRIIDNLFSNVKKYAMQNSRIYLTVKAEDNFACLEMKNVSKDEMDFDVERLTDRFVRGDDSRSTEGAGLGLSIAKSLTEIQGGIFNISVDGDLFKVTIKLPLAE